MTINEFNALIEVVKAMIEADRTQQEQDGLYAEQLQREFMLQHCTEDR